METARERGATHIDLGTSEDDTAALALYESAGFTSREGRPDGRRCSISSATCRAPAHHQTVSIRSSSVSRDAEEASVARSSGSRAWTIGS